MVAHVFVEIRALPLSGCCKALMRSGSCAGFDELCNPVVGFSGDTRFVLVRAGLGTVGLCAVLVLFLVIQKVRRG